MLVDLLIDAAARRGKVIAASDLKLSLTYKQMLAFAQVMRDVISSETSLDKVGFCLPASSAFCGCLFGALWARKKVVPLNFLLSERELADIVRASGIDLVLSVKPLAEIAPPLPVRTLYLEDLPIKRKVVASMFRRTPPPPAVDADETAVLMFTSGTSGDPKGVELTYSNLLSNCRDCIATAQMHEDQRFLNCLPSFHVFGLTITVVLPVVLGASVYCIPRFSANAVVRAIERNKLSILLAIPSMYQAIYRHKSAPSDLMRHVDLIISGGEPLSDVLADKFRERFGAQILQGYGLTETSPVCALELLQASRQGTIGRPINNVAVRIVDPHGRELPTNEEGELWIKGPNGMKPNYQNPEATAAVITPDGWFKTGDIGRIEKGGFIRLTGRLKEMLIVGGENVFPREIESVLERHPAVAEVAVIGAPDASRGEVPVAFVICIEGGEATEIELREFAREHLAGYKVPRKVIVGAELPRGPTGKVLKRKLSEFL